MQHILDLLATCTGFEWDAGNKDKNWFSHKVNAIEIEQAITNRPIALSDDVKHSKTESRYVALGKTDANRLLSIVFTIRGNRIRAISGRDMNRKEERDYEQAA